MATVILLRHGRTTANGSGILAGHQPVELDEAGRAQAVAVGERLRGATIPLATVVSSPLLRCRQTVEAALPGATVHEEGRLVECDYGDWSGRELKALAKQPLWQVVQAHPSAAVFPGGEAMADMAQRAVAAVRDWDARVTAEHGPDALWLACSHGDVIKAILADALGLHLDQFQRIQADPASLTVIRYTETRPFVLRLNDNGGKVDDLLAKSGEDSDAPVGGGA